MALIGVNGLRCRPLRRRDEVAGDGCCPTLYPSWLTKDDLFEDEASLAWAWPCNMSIAREPCSNLRVSDWTPAVCSSHMDDVQTYSRIGPAIGFLQGAGCEGFQLTSKVGHDG